MSDFEKLINASDLIEWIIETYPDWCEGAIRSIVDHIDEQPSAQSEIITCTECKYYDTDTEQCNNDYGLRFIDFGNPERMWCSWAERREE